MADISLIDYKFTYKELIEAKDLWESFLKSQMSSIYNEDYMGSAVHSSITHAMSGILGSLELLFDSSLDSLSLKDIPSELLYTHFGYLLKEKSGKSSLEDYREFLLTLLEVVFNGLTFKGVDSNLLSKFNIPTIGLEYVGAISNTTLRSKGLNNISSPLNLSHGLVLGDYNDNKNYYSSKESNVVCLNTTLDSYNSFNEREFLLIYEILKLTMSTITPLRVKFTINSKSSISKSSTVSIEQKHSITNFRGIDKHIIHFPVRDTAFTPFYIFPEDTFDLTKVTDNMDSLAEEFKITPEDTYNVSLMEEGNFPRVCEKIKRMNLLFEYGSFTYGSKSTYGSIDTPPNSIYGNTSVVFGGAVYGLENPIEGFSCCTSTGDEFGEAVFGTSIYNYADPSNFNPNEICGCSLYSAPSTDSCSIFGVSLVFGESVHGCSTGSAVTLEPNCSEFTRFYTVGEFSFGCSSNINVKPEAPGLNVFYKNGSRCIVGSSLEIGNCVVGT